MKKKIIYTQEAVLEILEDDGQLPHFVSPGIMAITDTLADAYEKLINLGINCALIESAQGKNPAALVGFHVQAIPAKTLPDGRTIYRQVDIISLPIIMGLEQVSTIWKVKHYYDAAYTQYAVDEFPDTYRKLEANDQVQITMPDGTKKGEWKYFAEPAMAGEATYFKQMLAQTVELRAAQGRFD